MLFIRQGCIFRTRCTKPKIKVKPPKSFFLLIGLLLCLSQPGQAQHRFPATYQPDRAYTGQSIYDLVHVSEKKVDVGLWALVIARTFDPALDVEHYLQRLDDMVAEIKRMLAGRTNDLDKLLAIKTFLYEPGPWNSYQPFDYDLDDPLGAKPENQLLSTYLDTRKGNYVSMPTLFLALMERLDSDVPLRGVIVPMHLFVRLHDRQSGDVWNIETTNGGHPARNRWYIEQMHIPQMAINQRTYLSDLTKREYLAALINVLTRRERFAKRYEEALAYAELALRLHRTSINALIQKGALLEWIVYEKIEGGKREGLSLSPTRRDELNAMNAQSQRTIEQARALGWRPVTAEERQRYVARVQAEKARRAALNQ